jgi:hypothetical protein
LGENLVKFESEKVGKRLEVQLYFSARKLKIENQKFDIGTSKIPPN